MYQTKKNGSTEHSKGNKTVSEKVATTCTEDGHRQTTKTSTAIQTRRTKEHRTTEKEMEGPARKLWLPEDGLRTETCRSVLMF